MKYVWLIATVLWFILMTFLSHQLGSETAATSLHLAELLGITDLNGILRKIAHVVTFAVLAVLVSLCLRAWDVESSSSLYWRFVFLVFLWTIIDEATKPLIPSRHFAWFDVGLNFVGVGIGVLVEMWLCG